MPSLLFSRSPTAPFPTDHHLTPSPAEQIASASANTDKLEKGQKWYTGLTMPGTLDLTKFKYTDAKLGLVFEDEDMMEATLLLLRFNCPYSDCPYIAKSWKDLSHHTLSDHALAICMICARQLSRFAHEQALYPPHLLGIHNPEKLARTQKPPRPRGQREIEMVAGWDPPHPMCEFCHEAFFGPDELFKHMRTKHEECEVCKSLGDRDVYFEDYAQLEVHHRQDHFYCKVPSCIERKFVVFGSEMDLRAHMISEHGQQMSNRDRANVRTLPIDFVSPLGMPDGPSRGRNQQSARGFSFARNGPAHQQVPLEVPMSPAQAEQQRRQVETDRVEMSRRRRGFDTSLTVPESQTRPSASHTPRLEEVPASGYNTPREDVDDAEAERHAALLSRVSMLVEDSPTRLSSFRSAIRQFRSSESSAKDMVDSIFNILDRDVDATLGVMKEVAGLLQNDTDGDKHRAVLEAINGFRARQRELFPSLSNPPTGLGTNYAGITSGKILQAKRTTHMSNSSSSRNVWDRVEAAASSSATPLSRPPPTNARTVPGTTAFNTASFPSLNTIVSSSKGPSISTHSTPWASGGAGSSSKTPSALVGTVRPSPSKPSIQPKPAPKLQQSAFPSLPSREKEDRKALFSKPTPKQESLRRIVGSSPAPVTNGWGIATTSVANGLADMSVEDRAAAEEAMGGEGGTGGGKKKNKGKQLLFSVSTRPS
ncbi:hypothetical protein M231_00331 [Tremella mesenterica]|uniref:C2H2-type domain-containing protein n=1 Tax=Tremella mesenterica TaxID=5217 RepID=A0A4Q1BW12_TREME|nr:hypothetical protein M231_00331 [Tremella mesenterica]